MDWDHLYALLYTSISLPLVLWVLVAFVTDRGIESVPIIIASGQPGPLDQGNSLSEIDVDGGDDEPNVSDPEHIGPTDGSTQNLQATPVPAPGSQPPLSETIDADDPRALGRSRTSTIDLSHEELKKVGLLAHSLQSMAKPKDWIDENGRRRPLKLKTAVSYYIRIMRVRVFILRYCFGKKSITGTTSDIRTLCPRCEALELTYEKFSVSPLSESNQSQYDSRSTVGAGSGQGREELGNLRTIAIKAIWCTFCKLIVNALQEQGEFADWLQTDSVCKDKIQGERQKALLKVKCSARWQIDGQTRRQRPFNEGEVRQLVEDNKHGRAVTRRILVEFTGADRPIQPTYIVLLAGRSKPDDAASGESSDFFGQHIETRHSSVSMMQNWLDRCTKEHEGRCNAKESDDRNIRLQPYFGVIDLEQWNLTRLPDGEKYVAISYCWGVPGPRNQPAVKTTKSNVRSYCQRGAIERIWNQIPRTIRDAMQLARRLGMRYFWVDSLCIVQDSDICWQLNANVMDQVYNNAYFTICAADGKNAWEGLRGLTDLMDSQSDHLKQQEQQSDSGLGEVLKNEKRLGRQYNQIIEPYAGDTRLMVSYPAEYYIDRSKWNTRAWTFQERLLSKRCLIFAEGRVFFQCRSMVLREDIITNKVGGWSIEHRNTPLELLGDVRHRPLKVYTFCVELYTKRELTKSGDILNAFNGVGTYIGKVLGNQGLLYGLPRSHFDWALLWQCSSDQRSKYRGRPEEDPKTGAIQCRDEPESFPTWSWCGWLHGEEYPAKYRPDMVDGTMNNVNDWLENHTWIQWYIRDGHGNLILVWNPKREPLSSADDRLPARWRGYTAKQNEPVKSQNGFDPYGRALCEDNPQTAYSEGTDFAETLDVFPFAATTLTTLEEEELFPLGRDIFKLDSMRFLQFKTLAAYFTVKPFNSLKQPSEYDGKDRRWAILDSINEIRGVIIPDRTEWMVPLEREGTVNVPDDYREKFSLGDRPHQFLALSDAKEFSPAEVKDWDTYTAREMEGLQWSLFYVMLVTERRGVHYRLGLGKVEKEAFRYSCQAGRAWKEIILG